ncbi:MAG: RnfABCDGE type electron transport complex subunit D [Phycisphaerae bacterium]|nr:RnfABCDGE type electron transport complex subunit D [Gemmatimonadaceae bacterium]
MTTSARLLKFFRTPKGLLIVVLSLLLLLASAASGPALVAPGVLGACLVAMIVDAPILRLREGVWQFPSGALLTGMIVAMVLSPHQSWHIAAVASAIAVVSKYVARTRSANVFNPAALALVVAYYVFDERTGQSWWGALPEMHPVALVALFAAGIFITDRVNKLPAVLAFLGCYYLLFTIASFVGDPGHVAGIYRAPDLHMTLFFAFFMVTDPPTSPPKQRDQVVFGVIVAVTSFAIFETRHLVYFMLAGLLVGNAWEAWRRWHHRWVRSKAKALSTAGEPAAG